MGAVGKNQRPLVTARWHFIGGKLSPAWCRLIADLSASRGGRDQKPAGVETNTAEEKKGDDGQK